MDTLLNKEVQIQQTKRERCRRPNVKFLEENHVNTKLNFTSQESQCQNACYYNSYKMLTTLSIDNMLKIESHCI